MGTKRPERLVLYQPDQDPCVDLEVHRNEDGQGVGWWVPGKKHALLCKYIDSAYGAARSFPGGWVFIDPFCGPGRIQVRGEQATRPGGAVAAWKQSVFSGTPFSRVLIGDAREDRVEACAARLKAAGAPVEMFPGKAVDTVQRMIDQVPKGSLALAYIDPYNLAFLDFEIMRALAELRSVDFVVNFFTSDLRRNVDLVGDQISPGWKTRVSLQDKNKANLALAFFADWQQQIQRLGFAFSKAMQLVENSNNAEMYRLVFFAKKQFPVGLWDDVAADPNRSFDFDA